MILDIKKDLKFLGKKSEEVKDINEEIKSLISDMIETMTDSNGIGLAAPQVGHYKRIILIQFDEEILPLINPVIVKKGIEMDIMEEGCLSIPEYYQPVKRSAKISVKAWGRDGQRLELDLRGMEARIFQHELDHLNGVLITDRLPLIDKVKRFITSPCKK